MLKHRKETIAKCQGKHLSPAEQGGQNSISTDTQCALTKHQWATALWDCNKVHEHLEETVSKYKRLRRRVNKMLQVGVLQGQVNQYILLTS